MAKRGMFFSIDALLAFTIILVIILIAVPLIKINKYESRIPQDILLSLSSIKIGEIGDTYVQSLVVAKVLDANKTALDQIAVLTITNETLSKNLAEIILQDIEVKENIGIWFGNKLIYSSNSSAYENANNILTERYIVSGLGGLNSTGIVSGYSARGFLSGTFRTAYAYFGGYIGDGNITKRIEYSGNLTSAEIEIAINNNFTIYINKIYSGDYAQSPAQITPAKYSLNNYTSNFVSGVNDIEFRGKNLYIAGGHIKITYETNASAPQEVKQYLPGINGTVNLYDGISSNGQLNSLEISLHYNIPYQSFLIIGNKTVWNGSSTGDNTTLISNAQLSSLLNYNELSNSTTPIRFGSENFSLIGNISSGNADVILITDVSGSMAGTIGGSGSAVIRNCSDPLLYSPNTQKLSLAKCLDQQFVYTILSGTNNKVGLVDFSTNANSYVNLTNNISLLTNTINNYALADATCVSCAINRAYLLLQANSNPSRQKYIITMTDGIANIRSTSICYDVRGSGKTSTATMMAQVGGGGAISHYVNSLWQIPSNSLWQDTNNVDLLNNTLGFAVGFSYQISRWNGNSWSLYQDLGSQSLYGISIFNSSLAFAVGDQGKIARWNGITWSEYQDTGNDNFKDIKIFNATFAFAVGDSGKIFKWNGSNTQWYQYQDIGNENLKALDILGPTYALAVGGSSGSVYIWNGNSWSLQQNIATFTATDVDIFNSTLAFITGDNDAVYKKSGSSSWVNVYAGTADLKTITIINSTSGFASGWPREGVIVWNGITWNKTYPKYHYQGNSTSGLSCSDLSTCSQIETAPMLNANYSSCRVNKELNATVHAIGFGNIAACGFANKTLRAVASCGNGSFYTSDNATQLQQIYQNISQNILQLSYAEQTALVSGNGSGILYPDSYIKLNYTKPKNPFGLILSLEEPFTNTTQGSFQTYANSTILDAQATSYSGARWTEKTKLNNNIIYDINRYGSSYTILGDPYSILLPVASVLAQNIVVLTTGVAPTNITVGSASNKIIYTLAKNFSSFSPILAVAQGCTWNIQFDDGTNLTAKIPSTYSGSNQCYFPPNGGFTHDPNDAFQVAVYNLLLQLDLDGNSMIDPKFTEQALQIDVSQVNGIPFTWQSEVQIRTWS